MSVAVRKQNYCVASCAAEILLVACSLSTVILFVAAFRAELVNNFLCKVNEVFDLGVVLCRTDHTGEVEIERTAAQIHTAEHLVVAVLRSFCRVVFCKVAFTVDFDELNCEFDLAQIAVADKVAKRAARSKSLQIESRKIYVCGYSQTDACVECGQGLQVDDHIAERIGKQAACVDDFRTCGIEVNQTAYAQRNVLILIGFLTALLVEFHLFCKCVASGDFAVRIRFGDGHRFEHSLVEDGALRSVCVVAVDVDIILSVVNVHCVVIFGLNVIDVVCVLFAVLCTRLNGCVGACVHSDAGEVFFAVAFRAFFEHFAFADESVLARRFVKDECAVCVNVEVGLAIHTRLEQVFAAFAFVERVVNAVVDEFGFSLIILASESSDESKNVGYIVVQRDEFESFVVVEKGLIIVDAFKTDFCIYAEF